MLASAAEYERTMTPLDHAVSQLGRGELVCDNGGIAVAEYFGRPHVPGRAYGNWCAAFVSWWLEKIGTSVPRSNGAKRVCKNVASSGSWVMRPRLFDEPEWLAVPRPCDVISWHRGPGDSQAKWWRDWRGHTGIVKSYDAATDTMITIEGNAGRFPAVVRLQVYPRGAWRRRLFGVARPPEM